MKPANYVQDRINTPAIVMVSGMKHDETELPIQHEIEKRTHCQSIASEGKSPLQ